MVADLAYAIELPDESQLREQLSAMVDFWRPRNALIDRARQMLEGKNPIAAPQSAQYKVKVMHMYHMQAAYNEKDARFLRLPASAVIPSRPSQAERARATRAQKAIQRAQEVIELQSDGNVWNRVKRSAIIFDAGVERWERAPAAFWPDLVTGIDGHDKLTRIHEDPDAYEKAREEYKKRCGFPIRSVFVPLDMFYPVYEGTVPIETFEIDRKSLRSVLANKLFDTTHLRQFANDSTGGLKTEVTLLYYCNQEYFAYYALAPTANNQWNYRAQRWPDASRPDMASIGQPILLHAYKHGLGETIYNIVGGRNGGWKSSQNDIEGVMEAVLELNQDADEIASQMLTNIRNSHWPNLVAYYDRDARGTDEGVPRPPQIQEGQNIAMWAGEDLKPIFTPQQDPQVEWMMRQIQQRIGELTGSSSVYGVHQPGVTTGYHENLQITMAEHLDNQIEMNLAQGAVNRVHKMLKHAKAMTRPDGKAEKLYVRTTERDSKKRAYSETITLDPDDYELGELVLSAKVKASRPIDFMANMQAALQATQLRPGHDSPLLDDGTALEQILGFTEPDEIEFKKVEQRQWEKLLQSDFIGQKIAERLNMLMVTGNTPEVNPEMAGQASGAFQQAFDTVNESGEAAAMGGTHPDLREMQIANRTEPSRGGAGGALTGVGGGMPAGSPQPAQTAARGQALMGASRV